jgi:NAD(P)-dependent dehydrogenase (short-subunit alcohol dehydrogenase family)
LKRKVAMISGGGGDIGRAVALELASRGADISLGDLKEQTDLLPFIEQLSSLGSNVLYRQLDIVNPESVMAWVEETESRLGVPTMIIPNAGVVTRKSILEMSPSEWRNEFDVNLNGAFYLATAAANRLVHHGLQGSIVFLGSWAAHRPNIGIPAYCVSKAGMRMLCQVMAMELARHGIVVNEVAPGIVNAGLSKESVQTGSDIREKIPLKTWIEPEEVAWQVANLCDPRNRNTTGSVFVVDGGLSMTNKWVK